jgi:flagellar basal-body rod modification protein FlgD
MSSVSGYVSNESGATTQVANSTGSSSAASGSGTSGDLAAGQNNLDTSYQTFLTLLTTQLQNQDPTSPMDPNAFTSELVQMTGVQQQLLSNQLLQQLVNASPSGGVTSSANLIGQNVTATSANANLANGQASWSYSLPNAAATGTATVTNSAGQVVYTGTIPNLAAGSSSFTWNGQNSSGVAQPSGIYTLSIAAADSSGGTITPTISVSGVVSSVQNVGGTTEVTIGSSQVPVSSITSINGSSSSSNSSGS